MDVWLVTPAWGRYEVTTVALAERAWLADVLAPRGVRVTTLVVADDDNLDIARGHGMETLEHPNDPLGAKWNAGIEHAAREGADFIAVIGSDDWVHPDVFDRLPAEEAQPPDLDTFEGTMVWHVAPEAVTGREIALVDMGSGRLRRCRVKGRYGVIPWVFPRVALERSGFRPVPDTRQKGLDGAMAAGLGVRPEWVFHDPHDVCRVDFKSDVNLNSFGAITGAIGYGPEEDAWPVLAERYPAELVELARKTSCETGMVSPKSRTPVFTGNVDVRDAQVATGVAVLAGAADSEFPRIATVDALA